MKNFSYFLFFFSSLCFSGATEKHHLNLDGSSIEKLKNSYYEIMTQLSVEDGNKFSFAYIRILAYYARVENLEGNEPIIYSKSALLSLNGKSPSEVIALYHSLEKKRKNLEKNELEKLKNQLESKEAQET